MGAYEMFMSSKEDMEKLKSLRETMKKGEKEIAEKSLRLMKYVIKEIESVDVFKVSVPWDGNVKVEGKSYHFSEFDDLD